MSDAKSMQHVHVLEASICLCLLHAKYCRSGNIRENLIFANIRELVASRIQSSR